MHRPDLTFGVTICPVSRVTPCSEMLAEQARGLMGFHFFDRCPNCKVTNGEFEAWGSNGHCQALIRDRAHLIHWLKIKARTQWLTRDAHESCAKHIAERETEVNTMISQQFAL